MPSVMYKNKLTDGHREPLLEAREPPDRRSGRQRSSERDSSSVASGGRSVDERHAQTYAPRLSISMSDLSFSESFAGTFAEGAHGAYSWKEYWEALVDDHCRFYIPFSAYLWCSAILLAASSVTLAIIHPSLVPGNTLPLWVLVVMGTYQLVQWIMFLNAFYRVVKSVLRRNVFLGKVWQMYLVQVITFAHFYLFLFLTSHTNKDEEDITLLNDQAFAFNADLNESEYGAGSSISGRTIKLVSQNANQF